MKQPKIISTNRVEFIKGKTYYVQKIEFFINHTPNINKDWFKYIDYGNGVLITKDKIFDIIEYA